MLAKTILEKGKFNTPEENRGNMVYWTGLVGLAINILLSILKVVLGILTHSISVMVDGVNNIMDSASSIVTIVGSKLAQTPADKRHPHGHGRIEYFSAFIVAVLILFVGFEFIKTSIEKILHPEDLYVPMVAIISMIVSILAKLYLNFLYKNIGEKIDSTPLKAAAVDSRNDVMTSGLVIVSLMLNKLFGLKIDGVIGIVISLVILYSGYELVKETLDELLGTMPSKEFLQTLEEKITGYDEVLGIHDIVVHNYGPENIIVILDVEMYYKIGFVTAHEIIERIQREVGEEMGIDLVIHLDPVGYNEKKLDDVIEKLDEIKEKHRAIYSFHDMIEEDGQIQMDMIINGNIYRGHREMEEFRSKMEKALSKTFPEYDFNIRLIKDYRN